jgi:hypothetical protein
MSSLAFTTGAWLWDKYGKAVTDKAAGAAKGRWDKFKWKDAAEAYRAKIKKLYGTMRIIGMAQPVPLDDIFTNAYMLDNPLPSGASTSNAKTNVRRHGITAGGISQRCRWMRKQRC